MPLRACCYCPSHTTGEWKFVNGQVKSVRMMHNLNIDGTPQYDTCNFELTIGRVWLVYFVKSMLTTIVVVIGSVYTALFLHPEDHLGDRAAVLFIAFLILVTNMQACMHTTHMHIHEHMRMCMNVYAHVLAFRILRSPLAQPHTHAPTCMVHAHRVPYPRHQATCSA